MDEDEEDGLYTPDCTGMVRPTLIQELSKILDEYPDDGQILKELIQNAEDASASEMKILYDNRQRLLSQNSKSAPYTKYFQSPALCVHNNEYFTKKDWDGIKQIGQSVKELDPSKVGRFGLGFKSVFHITDFPMVMSGEQMLIIDPYRDEAKCCIVFDLNKLSKYKGFNMNAFMEAVGDVFGKGNNIIQKGCYEGTLFRFPLRYTGTNLSNAVYSDDKIKNLLSVFQKEASVTLIFLKTLEEMHLFTGWDSMMQGKPDFHIKISGFEGCDVKGARKEMLSAVGHLPERPIERRFILTIECFEKEFAKKPQSWIVVNRLEGRTDASRSLVELSDDLHYLPYVGVALPYNLVDSFVGHIFCFLPLPMQGLSMTNLPVHVHGQFALSQNRQHLKWADVLTHEKYKEKTVKWNECLISETLPKAYFSLIHFIVQQIQVSATEQFSMIARSLPDLQSTNDHFKVCVKHLFDKLGSFPFLWTTNNGGRWISCHEAVFPIFDDFDQNDVKKTIVDCLESYNVNLVKHKDYKQIYDFLVNAGLTPQTLTQDYLSRLLRSSDTYRSFRADIKDSLLMYLVARKQYALLDNLELLPLANGSYTTFQHRFSVKVYVCTKDQQGLFPGMEERIVKQLPQATRDLLLQSGISQLAEIQEVDIISLMRQSITSKLGGSQHGIPLAWPRNSQLDENWLNSVWKFFTHPLKNIPKDLPILPQIIVNGERYLYTIGEPLILQKHNRGNISAGVVCCLKSMDIAVLPKLPVYVINHPHVMKSLIELPNLDGVLKVLADVNDRSISNFNNKVQRSDREELVSFLGSHSSFSLTRSSHWNRAKKVLQRLNIFHSDNNSFLSIIEECRISQAEPLPVPLPFRCLTCMTTDERNFARSLGAQEMELNDAIEYIFKELLYGSFYNDVNKTNVMKYFMKKFHQFKHSEKLMSLAMEISFVLDGNCQSRRPCDLFDPRNKLLVQMLNDSGQFPRSRKNENLVILIKVLGQREELLTEWYLHDHLAELQIISPLKKPRDYPHILPWYTSKSALCTPMECAIKDHLHLVGSTMPLFSDDCSKEFIRTFHPIEEELQVTKIIEQLYCVIKHYEEKNKPELLPVITKIYRALNKLRLNETIVEEMMREKIVWMGHGFCCPNEVYLNSDTDDLHLEPYVYKLPTEVDAFKDFFRVLGCMSEQCPEMYLDVQRRIQELGSEDRLESECHRDLRIVISILNYFKEKNSALNIEELLLPIKTASRNRLQLHPASECNFCNEEWLKDLAEEEGDEVFYVHEDVPVSTATILGAKSLTDSLLEGTGLLDWEQEVSLVSRIKSLLKGYKDGFSVPKELIQNADDAGASKVCFLYDERENKDCMSKLMNENMSDCQGPALWVYNDALFSDSDLKNITDVEGATKGSDLSKTGKFGVGFCSVYNLTDVPSFVSGKHMVMFDPQGLYLTKDGKKGMKIDLQSMKNRTLLRRMRNQFKPFNGVFDCDLNVVDERNSYYDGTLFRFPLRTHKQATSDISSIVYDNTEMQKLLGIFMQCAGNLLLFTQTVSEIELYHLPANKSDPNDRKLIFRGSRVIKEVLQNPSSKKMVNNGNLSVLRKSANKLEMIRKGGIMQREIVSLTYLLAISIDLRQDRLHGRSNNLEETNWIISWAEGLDKCVELSLNPILSHALPLASTAALVGQTEGKSMCLRLTEAPYGFYRKGHLFCTLPLPIETPFQFHISSSFAITQDRKQLSTETKEDKLHLDTTWNQSVMGDAVVQSFVNLLRGLREFGILPGNKGHTLWPIANHDSANGIFGCTQNGFIGMLVLSSLEIIYHHKLRQWTSFDKCRVMDSNLLHSSIGDLAYEKAIEYCMQKGECILELPDEICNLFESKVGNDFTSKILTAEMFYSEVFFPLLETDKLTEIEIDKFVLHAVDINNGTINQMLKTFPCFPSCNGALCKPSELLVGSSSLRKFYVPSDGKFLPPRKPYNIMENEHQFKNLGMVSEILPEEWLIDRVKTVERLLEECSLCALQRTRDLHCYMSRSNVQISKETRQELQTIRFLPVSIKPPGWNYSWKASKIAKPTKWCFRNQHVVKIDENLRLPKTFAMACPKELFFNDCKELVGCSELLLHQQSLPFNHQVLEYLGVNGKKMQDIPLGVVVDQLNILSSECYEKILNKKGINGAFLRQTLNKVMSWLEHQCSSTAVGNTESCNMESLKQAFLPLQNKPVLFLNDKLWRPDEVSFSLPNSNQCFPHLAGIQQSDSSLKSSPTFLKLLGVKDKFTSEDISNVLVGFQSQVQEGKLNNNELEQTCGLLGALFNSLEEEKVAIGAFEAFKNGNILVPDVDGYLCRASDLCIDDDDGIQKSESMRFVSDKLPRAHAVMFGVKSKMKRKVKDHYKPIAFGQREEVTTRIQRILDGYPADESILKELLQNADDAGASELHIVTDYTTYPHDSVFDGKWKELQGPALLVYNNSSFSESDLEGIQLLGIGSKSDDPAKTGQYGVGFNAVYHLTDAPSFISKGPTIDHGNETLCVLDPQCKYAEDADGLHPGARYCHLDDLRKLKSDVFKPYHEEKLMGDTGTIFRFPLRNSDMAESSKIRNGETTEDSLEEMLRQFRQEAPQALLFLKNIRKIIFSTIDDGNLESNYSVNVEVSEEDDKKRRNFNEERRVLSDKVRNGSDVLSGSALTNMTKLCITEEILADIKVTNTADWCVFERIGFGESIPPDAILEAYRNNSLGHLPVGGVAFPDTMNNFTKPYKAFCFLPLPTVTGLPMHINGHFALNHESRRNLWEDNKESLKNVWNKNLLSSVIVPVYISALEYQRDLCKQILQKDVDKNTVKYELQQFFSFFPEHQSATDTNWKYLCTEIYTQMLNDKNLFPTVKSIKKVQARNLFEEEQIYCSIAWISVQQEHSVGSAVFCSNEDQSMDPASVPTIMKDQNLRIIDFSMKVFQEMVEAKLDVKNLASNTLVHFLKSHKSDSEGSCEITGFGSTVENTSFKSVERVKNVLYFCINGNPTNFKKEMIGIPLCVLNDGTLTEFSTDSPPFCSKHCGVMKGLGNKFINIECVSLLKGFETPCLKKFGLDDFSELIKFVLSPEIFCTSNRVVKCDLKQQDVPHGSWLKNVWEFINESVCEMQKKSKNKKEFEASKKLFIRELKGKLGNWNLLPVVIENETYLQCINQSAFVLDLPTFINLKHLYDVIKVLNVPCLQICLFRKWNDSVEFVGSFTLVKSLVASCYDPVMVLQCLVHHLKNKEVDLSEDYCNAIMEYFNDNLGTIKKEMSNCASRLRELPLYVTVSGEKLCLQNQQLNVIVLPKGMELAGIEEWAERSRVVLLKVNERISSLHKFLGFASSCISRVYIDHIIPSFSNIPDDSLILHLQFIRDVLLNCQRQSSFDEEQEFLISALKDCEFVLSNGQRKCARDFYSPHHEVFNVMMGADFFPPEPLSDDSWKKFMELSGMKKDVEPAMIIDFAMEIASEGRVRLTEDTCRKSEVLLKHLNRCSNEELNKEPLYRIKSISFVVPFKEREGSQLLALHPQYQGGNLVSFEDAVPEKWKNLVWTSSCILPRNAYVNYLGEELFVRVNWLPKKPQTVKIVRNLQNISDVTKQIFTSSSNISSIDKIERLFRDHYDFLLKNCLEEEVISDLKEIPIVFLGKERSCVLCRQIVFNLEEEKAIKPYLFSAPLHYGHYSSLFEKLGTCTKETATHYAQVLHDLYLETIEEHRNAEVLDPNELGKLRQAVFRLFTTSTPNEICVPELYLPDRFFALQKSRNLIASDSAEFEERMEIMQGKCFFLGFHALNLMHLDEVALLKQLPENFQPKILTETVYEKVLSPRVVHRGRNIAMLSQFLKCDEFVEGICRLILDERKKFSMYTATAYSSNYLSEKEQDSIRKKINNIEVEQVAMLETVLVRKSDGQTLQGSTAWKISMAEKKLSKSGTDSWSLYCVDNHQNLTEWFDDISDDISKILSCVSNQEMRENQKYIQQILRCIQNPSEIERVLNKRKIARFALSDSTSEMFPSPGTFVPKCLHHRLDNRFSEFEKEEYVALMVHEEEIENGELLNDPVYMYAVVRQCLGKPEHVSLHGEMACMQNLYLLDIGNDTFEEFPAFKIFKFHRRKGPRSTDIQQAVNLDTGSRRNLDDTLIEVRQQFLAIIALDGESERRILLRRLRARYHPDQNYGNEEEATRVFQFLEDLIRRMREGEFTIGRHSTRYPTQDIPSTYSPPPRQPFYKPSHQPSSCSDRREKLSVPQVARKWLTQAKRDVFAAESFLPNAPDVDGFNWICYMCHQVSPRG
ncbi:hypothetical protein FSP39_008727 [Pinctada imbricata]|uniref:Sacsin/Nov domain-containing protein n=1 Tax=Pinctada imbricata TaxID=66713 RepID=A0AA89BP18_PINIB|nr:hypothetical protein FSP39_008727 [Pinctada imbricata]